MAAAAVAVAVVAGGAAGVRADGRGEGAGTATLGSESGVTTTSVVAGEGAGARATGMTGAVTVATGARGGTSSRPPMADAMTALAPITATTIAMPRGFRSRANVGSGAPFGGSAASARGAAARPARIRAARARAAGPRSATNGAGTSRGRAVLEESLRHPSWLPRPRCILELLARAPDARRDGPERRLRERRDLHDGHFFELEQDERGPQGRLSSRRVSDRGLRVPASGQ